MYKNKIVKLVLWSLNTYGRGISKYMRTPQGFVLVFDVTNQSFEYVKGCLQYIERYSYALSRIIILGTKSDCVKKRCVEREEVEAFIADFPWRSEIKYFETSAKDPHVSTNISTIIENLVADTITENPVAYEFKEYQPEIPKIRDGGCCVVS